MKGQVKEVLGKCMREERDEEITSLTKEKFDKCEGEQIDEGKLHL